MRIFIFALSLTAACSSAALCQPLKIIGTSGPCKALLNETDMGCENNAVLSTLPNGHRIFNFPVKTMTLIGFGGEQMDRVVPGKPSLQVERVYIDQSQFDADGTCSFKTKDKEKSFYAVECEALLRDGRKVSVTLDPSGSQPAK